MVTFSGFLPFFGGGGLFFSLKLTHALHIYIPCTRKTNSLDAVVKMQSVRSADKKSNLLRFLASELASERHRIKRVGSSSSSGSDGRGKSDGLQYKYAAGTTDLREELSHLESASKSSLEEVRATVGKMGKGLTCIRRCLEKSLTDVSTFDGEDSDDGGEEDASEQAKAERSKRRQMREEVARSADHVEKCFASFLEYADSVRNDLAARMRTTGDNGEKLVAMFAEDPKKMTSSTLYQKLFDLVKLIEKAHADNEREAAKRAKREQREANIAAAAASAGPSALARGGAVGGSGGTFAAHTLFQSGGASDIVARVRRKQQMRREDSNRETGFADWKQPPAPPAPPPHLAALGK